MTAPDLLLGRQQTQIPMSNSNDFTTLKPGAGSALNFGWSAMKFNFLAFFLLVFLLSLLSAPLEFFSHVDSFTGDHHDEGGAPQAFLQIFAIAFGFLIYPVIDYGAQLLFVHGVRRQKLDMKLLGSGFQNYLNIVLTNLLIVGLVGIATVAFIIPGIIVGCRLAFSSYLVMDKGMDPISAVETSWKLTSGHGWKVFGLGLMCIGIFILGLLMVIVGVFPAVMWAKASFASLYQAVLNEKGEDFFPAAVENQ